MNFEKLALQRIEEAIARGEFDELPGRGRPLDLDDYFRAPEHLRMAYSILKGANVVPEEIELLREIARLRDSLAACTGQEQRKALGRLLCEKTTRLSLLMERFRRAARRA